MWLGAYRTVSQYKVLQNLLVVPRHLPEQGVWVKQTSKAIKSPRKTPPQEYQTRRHCRCVIESESPTVTNADPGIFDALAHTRQQICLCQTQIHVIRYRV